MPRRAAFTLFSLIGLAENANLPWSLELIERYEDRWMNWEYLSSNEGVPWSLSLIERFANRWDWGALSANRALALPSLSATFIDEIMVRHSPEILRQQPSSMA